MKQSTKWFRVAVVVMGLLNTSSLSHADGIDIVPYLLRSGGTSSLALNLVMVPVLMLVNYFVNLLVIGSPAIGFGKTTASVVAIDLVTSTLLGQVADRVGALVAMPMAGIAVGVLGMEGEGAWFFPLLILNFVFSGVAIGLLAFHFLRRRWGVLDARAWLMALAAGVATNPAWAMAMWFS